MKFLFFFLISIFFAACQHNPYAATNKAYEKQARALAKEVAQHPGKQSVATAAAWVGTTNFNLRKPNIVVIHHTAQNSCEQTLKTFTLPRTSVSAHYVICKDGTVHHMLNDYLRAWHGGVGRWGSVNDVNSTSIGIEIDNNGTDAFTDQQISSLLIVLDSLKKRYSIPAANFIGHSDIAPTRKVDPNIHFPWKDLSLKGFGLWWSDTTGVKTAESFDHILALRVIGYDVKDTAAVYGAFNRKFLQREEKTFGEESRKILYTLYKKY